MVRGAIRQLIHLSTGTDLPATHLVPAANGVGYGYIATADGDVFFDYAAVKNLRFDQLTEGMTVEYALDQAPDPLVGCDNCRRPRELVGRNRARGVRSFAHEKPRHLGIALACHSANVQDALRYSTSMSAMSRRGMMATGRDTAQVN